MSRPGPDPEEGARTSPREDDEGRTELGMSIEIDADGRVVFTDLPADLADLVRALDPDALISCDLPPEPPPDPPSGRGS